MFLRGFCGSAVQWIYLPISDWKRWYVRTSKKYDVLDLMIYDGATRKLFSSEEFKSNYKTWAFCTSISKTY